MLHRGAASARGRWQVPVPDAGGFWLGPWMPGGRYGLSRAAGAYFRHLWGFFGCTFKL